MATAWTVSPSELREGLDALGITQVEFAARIGVTRTAIIRWFQGVRTPTGIPLSLVMEGMRKGYPSREITTDQLRRWMQREAYTTPMLAGALGVNPTTVRRWLGILDRGYDPPRHFDPPRWLSVVMPVLDEDRAARAARRQLRKRSKSAA